MLHCRPLDPQPLHFKIKHDATGSAVTVIYSGMTVHFYELARGGFSLSVTWWPLATDAIRCIGWLVRNRNRFDLRSIQLCQSSGDDVRGRICHSATRVLKQFTYVLRVIVESCGLRALGSIAGQKNVRG